MDKQRGSPRSELKFLERLSIDELEALLRFSGDPADVEVLFDTVVEAVVAREEKNPTGRLPDVDAAWDELQMMYDNGMNRERPSAGENASPDILRGHELQVAQGKDRPRRSSLLKVARVAAVMAAAMVLLLVLMIGAQAAGADVFGVLARWTEGTFYFETRTVTSTYCEALHNTIQEVFENQGIIGEYVPTWYPEGYNISSVMTADDKLGTSVRILLSNELEKSFGISVDQYKEKKFIDPQTFEIEANSVEKYPSNNRTYYIFSNDDSATASWSDGNILQRIWGDLTVPELKSMIDSVGGK